MIAAIKVKRKSVSSILEDMGKPTETSTLVKKVAEVNAISKAQAYREISKAWKNKEIRKVTLPDRSVLNLLPEWNLPTSTHEKEGLSFEDYLLYRQFQRLDRIGEENSRDSVNAMLKVGSLIMTFPKDVKQEVVPCFLKAKRSLMKEWKKAEEQNGCPTTLVGASQVDYVVGAISDALYERLKDNSQAGEKQ
jgi:hypothetical protein